MIVGKVSADGKASRQSRFILREEFWAFCLSGIIRGRNRSSSSNSSTHSPYITGPGSLSLTSD